MLGSGSRGAGYWGQLAKDIQVSEILKWQSLSHWPTTTVNMYRAAKTRATLLLHLKVYDWERNITREFWVLSKLCQGLALHRKSRQRSSITWKTLICRLKSRMDVNISVETSQDEAKAATFRKEPSLLQPPTNSSSVIAPSPAVENHTR